MAGEHGVPRHGGDPQSSQPGELGPAGGHIEPLSCQARTGGPAGADGLLYFSRVYFFIEVQSEICLKGSQCLTQQVCFKISFNVTRFSLPCVQY